MPDSVDHVPDLGSQPANHAGDQQPVHQPADVGNGQPITIGVVATNQHRKDWGLGATICAELSKRDRSRKFWWHVDVLDRAWNLRSLLADFSLAEAVRITHPPLTDQQMADLYRQCAVTLHIGLGEGFGYPIFESLFCGVPAIHGDYAGGASILRSCGLDSLLIQPSGWRLDGPYNQLRPVYDPLDWVVKVESQLSNPEFSQYLSECSAHLAWSNLAGRWRRWLTDGIQNSLDNVQQLVHTSK